MSSVRPLDYGRTIGGPAAAPLAADEARQSGAFAITILPSPGEGLRQLFQRLSKRLVEREAVVLKLLVFGSVQTHQFADIAMRQVFGAVDWPVTWVQGIACHDHPIAGIQALAVSGSRVQRIVTRGCVVASVFEDDRARHCLLGGIGPGKTGGSPADQTARTFQEMNAALKEAGFAMSNVVRTWFYLDQLLDWYDDFNRVRTAVYSTIDFQLGAPPASTGVSGRNPSGAALVAGAWAIQPFDRSTLLQPVSSPLQCSALRYGSAFSRAVEWSSAGGNTLLISGTASIAPEGETLCQGDTGKQIHLTMDVVEAILRSRDFELTDITRATAYFKNVADAKLFTRWRIQRGLTKMPVLTVQCDICRDNLLFELEADAWKPEPHSPADLPDFVV
jgi:enamine deaminase RidA (YjgF/YER057c/UK114 family)